MEVGDNSLYLHLHKLSGVKADESLDQLVSAIWHSRKTGLRGHHDKSHFQSLLNLSTLSDLDPVLACLRSMIRKCAYDNGFTGDDLVKLFPPDLPLDLQQSLLILFQKHQSQWKDDVSREERRLSRSGVSCHVQLQTRSTASSVTSFPSSNVSEPLWHRQHNGVAHLDHQINAASSMPILSENNATRHPLHPMVPHRDFLPSQNMGILPSLKSMNWSMKKCDSDPIKRVAVIVLKLQDFTNSSSGETEVKFQLTRDTLEAMLRSMTYINDQLSGMVCPEPLQKKQRQSDQSA